MKTYVPDYYLHFSCIAGKCRHTCCAGWEIEVDPESLKRFCKHTDIMLHISEEDPPQIRLLPGEICPFLNEQGLCRMILRYGEDMLCQTCRDHPRFRNFWSDRIEMGIGLVCEEAARIILSRTEPMRLLLLEEDDCDETDPDADEAWLMSFRNELLTEAAKEPGPFGRLREYLIYRHIPDALYDDRLEERIGLVDWLCDRIKSAWEQTDHSMEALAECAREYSYDVEYDEERKEVLLNYFSDNQRKDLQKVLDDSIL